MSIRIHKFTLAIRREQVIRATVVRWLEVGWQQRATGEQDLTVWAEVLVDPESANRMEQHVAVAMTGEAPPEAMPGFRVEHLGSAHTSIDGEPFVAHLYLTGARAA